MNGNSDGIRSSMIGVEQRLALLQSELQSGAVTRTPALDQASEDLAVSLEELHVALEEVETTNEELASAKLAAEEESRRYEQLFQLAPAASLVTDAAGVIQEANLEAESLLGRRALYLIGKPLSVCVDPADRSRFVRFLDQIKVSDGSAMEDTEIWIQSGSDRRFTAGLTGVPIRDREGRVRGARWLVRDISSQLREERGRREAGEREAYRQMAGGVINHVNNLLASIRGYSEIIARQPETGDRALNAANRIHAATERGERMTRQLLSFAREGRQPATARSINRLVQQACVNAKQYIPEGARLTADLFDDAPFADVRIGVRDVDQIVFNLILNAADALGHEGEIFVATEIVTLDEAATGRLDLDLDPGRYLIISVRDNGAGMDSETRARAFEPFYSTKPIGKGFGLGLSTVEATVQEAKGAAIIQSEPGAGSSVALYLPVVPAR